MRLSLISAGLLALSATLAQAGDATRITVEDAYARVASPVAKAGAAFVLLKNNSDVADRLIGVRSDAAQRVELHTHIDQGDGVMKMVHVEEGFEIPAGGTLMMMRGAAHVMFMGLTTPFDDGALIKVTLVFEEAGEIEVTVPVDLTRKPRAGAHGN